MKTTANNARYLKASKLHFVFLMILIGLLFFRTLAAQDTTAHSGRGSKKLKPGRVSSGPASVRIDSTRKEAYSNSYWIDLGLGRGGQGGAFDIGFSYEVAPQRIISIHYMSVATRHRYEDYFLFIPVASYPAGEDASAVDITYGFLKKGKAGIMNFSAGLSFVKIQSGTGRAAPVSATGFDAIFGGSTRPADYKLRESNPIGLAFRAQFVPSLRWGGIGISPYLNINPVYTFASVTIQVALGKMREKVRKPRRSSM